MPYNTIPETDTKPASMIRKGDVLFLGGAGERIVASEPYRRMGYFCFETQWVDGQNVGRWMVRDDSEVIYLTGVKHEETDDRPKVTEAVFEKIVDGEVARRLMRDPRYRNAENAEDQADAENAIEAEVTAEKEAKYRVL